VRTSAADRWLGWSLLAGAVVANGAGYAFDLYQRFWWFDRVLHGATTFAVTLWLALFVFMPAIRGQERALGCILLASVGLAGGALWEIAEWIFDQLASGDIIKGKEDTLLDLVMDTAGAMLAGIASFALLGRSKIP
jgi:hypothetical protein